MINILPFDPHHAGGVVGLILPIQQSEFQIAISLEAQPDLRGIPAFYQKGNGNFWVAMDDQKDVGTVGLLDIGNCAISCYPRRLGANSYARHFLLDDTRLEIDEVAEAVSCAVVLGHGRKFVEPVVLGTQQHLPLHPTNRVNSPAAPSGADCETLGDHRQALPLPSERRGNGRADAQDSDQRPESMPPPPAVPQRPATAPEGHPPSR